MRTARKMGIYTQDGQRDLFIVKDGVWQTAGGNWASRGVSYNQLTTSAVAPVRSDGSGYLGFNTVGNNTDLRSGTASAGNYIDLSGYSSLKMIYDCRIPPMDVTKDSAVMRVYFGAQNAAQFAATTGYAGLTQILEYAKSSQGAKLVDQTATINISGRSDACKPSIGIWWAFLYIGSDSSSPGYVHIKDMWLSKG